jgi:hypothetical protein
MKTTIALLLAAVVILGACATSPDRLPATTSVPGTDEFDIEATVLAVYNVLSGPAGRRDWDRFEALFAPGARIVVDGEGMTTKEFVDRNTPKLNAAGSFAKPVATRVLRYGDIAHVWSMYEGREAANQEQASSRGVRSIQLVRIGTAWKVQSLLSQREDAAHPIPPGLVSR